MFKFLLDMFSFIFLLGATTVVLLSGLVIGTALLTVIDRVLTRWHK